LDVGVAGGVTGGCDEQAQQGNKSERSESHLIK
jgi:hypothetical protein